jgi:hypothetical protein
LLRVTEQHTAEVLYGEVKKGWGKLHCTDPPTPISNGFVIAVHWCGSSWCFLLPGLVAQPQPQPQPLSTLGTLFARNSNVLDR